MLLLLLMLGCEKRTHSYHRQTEMIHINILSCIVCYVVVFFCLLYFYNFCIEYAYLINATSLIYQIFNNNKKNEKKNFQMAPFVRCVRDCMMGGWVLVCYVLGA